MNKQIDTILQREVTRKEFLTTVGFGVASLMGVGSILSLIRPNKATSQAKGYGSNAYGG